MKKLLIALLLCLSSLAFAQGVRVDLSPIINSHGVQVPNVNVVLCTGAATVTGSTCSIQTQSFTDATLTTRCSTGFTVTQTNSSTCSATSDSIGNPGFWLAPGAFIYCKSGPNITGKCYNLNAAIGITASGSGTTSLFNNTCYANQQSGTDLGAKINTCLALGNGTDIVISASGTISTPVLINNLSSIRIRGLVVSGVVLNNGITGSNAACAIKISGTSSIIFLEHFGLFGNALTGASGNGNGICTVGTGAAPRDVFLRDISVQNNRGTGVDGTGASMNAAGLYVYKSIDVFVDGGGYGGNQQGIILDTNGNNIHIKNTSDFQNVLTAFKTLHGGFSGVEFGPGNDVEGNGNSTGSGWMDITGCARCSIHDNYLEGNAGEAIFRDNTTLCSMEVYGNLWNHGGNGQANPNTTFALDTLANCDINIHNNYLTLATGVAQNSFIDINPSSNADVGKGIRENTFDILSGGSYLGNVINWQKSTQNGKCILEGNSFGSRTNPAFATAGAAVQVGGGGTLNGCRVLNNSCSTSSGTISNCVAISSGATNTVVGNTTISTSGGAITNTMLDNGAGTVCLGAGCPSGAAFTVGGTNLEVNSAGNIFAKGTIQQYGGFTTVSNGVPVEVAKADATAQTFNIARTLLYAVPATGSGTYRASCYLVVTKATTSSTLPSCAITFTDNDSNTSTSPTITATNTGNTVGTTNSATDPAGQNSGVLTFQAKASTNINYQTIGYASSGATPMQYAFHIKLEFLGN